MDTIITELRHERYFNGRSTPFFKNSVLKAQDTIKELYKKIDGVIEIIDVIEGFNEIFVPKFVEEILKKKQQIILYNKLKEEINNLRQDGPDAEFPDIEKERIQWIEKHQQGYQGKQRKLDLDY